MSATTATLTPIAVKRIERIRDNERAMEQLHDGLANAAACLRHNAFDVFDPDGRDPREFDWERRVVHPAIDEITEAVADLLSQAIAKRLPWTSGG